MKNSISHRIDKVLESFRKMSESAHKLNAEMKSMLSKNNLVDEITSEEKKSWYDFMIKFNTYHSYRYNLIEKVEKPNKYFEITEKGYYKNRLGEKLEVIFIMPDFEDMAFRAKNRIIVYSKCKDKIYYYPSDGKIFSKSGMDHDDDIISKWEDPIKYNTDDICSLALQFINKKELFKITECGYYKTRNNKKIKIIHIKENKDFNDMDNWNAVIGIDLEDDKIVFFSINGIAPLNNSENDIISKCKEENFKSSFKVTGLGIALKEGQKYLMRNGEIAMVFHVVSNSNEVIVYHCSDGEFYTYIKDGKFASFFNREYDIISELQETVGN